MKRSFLKTTFKNAETGEVKVIYGQYRATSMMRAGFRVSDSHIEEFEVPDEEFVKIAEALKAGKEIVIK